MNCDETRRLLGPDVDGELDLVQHLEIEAHLRTCPACASRARELHARRAALRAALPRFPAPPGLSQRIRAALPADTQGATAPATPAVSTPSRSRRFALWQLGGLAASLALALLAGFRWGETRAQADRLFADAIDAHVRSLQVDHLTDVASTDQHTVKPWFAGKIDFSPPVVDLAPAGFPLTGGRLERIDDRPVAALVFHRRQHALNLFVWPAQGAVFSDRRFQRDGYHVQAWSQGGLDFLAVSEIPVDDLERFVTAYRAASR